MSRVQAITCSTLISRTLWHTLSWAWTVILCQWTCPEYRQSPAAHAQQNFVAHTFLSMNQLFSVNEHVQSTGNHLQHTNQQNFVAHTFLSMNQVFSVNEHVHCTGNHLQHTNQQNFVAHTFLSMNHYSLSMNMSRVQAITCSTLTLIRELCGTHFPEHEPGILCQWTCPEYRQSPGTLISRTLWHTLSWAWTVILCQWTCPEYRQSPAAH